MKYRVLASGLCYPTDPRIIRRLQAGENIPMAQRGMCEPHRIGDIVDDVPKASVPGLLAKGWLELVQEVGE